MTQLESPHKDEKVCANCKHLAWLIAVGQGLRCTHKSVFKQAEFNLMPPMVPSRRHTCNNFESRHEDEKQG